MNDLALPIRNCLLEPPEEAGLAATLLGDAVDALLEGNEATAARLLSEANIGSLRRYAAFVMSPTAELLGFDRRTRELQPRSAVSRLEPRMPTGAEAEVIYQRDGYRCRYCGCRVVRSGVRSLLTAMFPEVVQWPGGKGGDQLKHAAFYALNAVLDHVEPYSRGGNSSAANIVTACWPCNFGKENHTIEELRLHDPRLRSPVIDEWDGLTRLVRHRRKPAPAQSAPQKTAFGEISSDLDDWLTLLDGTTPRDVVDALRDLLFELEGVPAVKLSIRTQLIVSVMRGAKHLGVFGLSPEGNIDVPWLIEGEKDWFKPFAESVAAAVPNARLYETARMWRVDGCGAAKGQITIEELIGASRVILAGIQQLAQFETAAGRPHN